MPKNPSTRFVSGRLRSGDPTKKTVEQFRGLVEQVNALEVFRAE